MSGATKIHVAYGLPDVAVSWGLDLQLLCPGPDGRLASQCMALRVSQYTVSPRTVPSLLATATLKSKVVPCPVSCLHVVARAGLIKFLSISLLLAA